MRGLFTTNQNLTFIPSKAARALASNHFGNHLGGSPSGLFIPGSSALIEWREAIAGTGYGRAEGVAEGLAWRFRAGFSVEHMAAR